MITPIINTHFTNAQSTTLEICKGSGEKCEAVVETTSGTIKVKSSKTKSSASVIVKE